MEQFIEYFEPLFKKGLPFFWKEKGAMLTKDAYYENLIARRKEHLKFVDMTSSLTSRIIVDMLANEFEILFSFKEACVHLHIFSYHDHFELHVLAKEMSTLELPSPDQ